MSNPAISHKSGSKKVYQWQDLQELVSPAILSAPRIDWSAVEHRHIQYLIRTVHGEGAVWFEHLALLTAVLATYIGLDASTIDHHISNLHARWRQLFLAYELTTVADWQPEEHLPRYFNDQSFTDSLNTRQEFLRSIEAICQQSQQLDPQGKGIKKAGILGNAEAYAYYRQHCAPSRRTRGRVSRQSATVAHRLPTDPHRDLRQVRRRYSRESKAALVERLLSVEQAYLESQQQLARLQFELLDQQQKTQKRHENTSF